MSMIKPFRAVRPAKDLAKDIGALPYDVYNFDEAKAIVKAQPKSFLKIDRAETFFGEQVTNQSPKVYEKAREVLYEMLSKGEFVQEKEAVLYLYELTMNHRSQVGIVSCSSVDEYLSGAIKKHENTRADKEEDRIKHVDYCNANTGPIFLTYRSKEEINSITKAWQANHETLFDFVADDGVGHKAWLVDDRNIIDALVRAFGDIEAVYIADGHHRAASAVKVAQKRRRALPNYTGEEPFNFFLSVSFPDDQLMILPYNRLVKDLNGMSKSDYLAAVRKNFDIIKESEVGIEPKEKAMFSMFLEGKWYLLKAKKGTYNTGDPVLSLDVSLLQLNILSEILGIGDPRVDERIDFVGGIRGLEELERRVGKDMEVAFALYPTSINELMAIADAGKLMPPKSTWFEPKLRSGLFIHLLS